MKEKIITILQALLAVALCVAGGYLWGVRSYKPQNPVVYRDTLVKVQEVIVEKPVTKYVNKIRTEYIKVPVTDTLATKEVDTLYVPVPIEQKTYKDSLYTAYVSGYKPSLDSLRILLPKTYYTNTIVVEQKSSKKRLSAGLQGGMGVVLPFAPSSSPSLGGYLGLGLTLSF